MAQFGTFDSYVDALQADPPLTRLRFLERVRFARIEQLPGTVSNVDYARAIGCVMAWGWIRRSVQRPTCNAPFHLGIRTRHSGLQSVVWRGPSPKQARVGHALRCWCYGRQRSVGGEGIMSTITLPNWMDFLDTACMWANDYPKAIMYSEIKGGANKVIDMWCSTLQPSLQPEWISLAWYR